MKLFNKTTNNALIAVLLGIILYVVLLSGASILRYKVFRASAFDMAIEIQNIWNTSHGRLLEDSINLGFIIPRFWVAHWEFIFIPLAGLFRLFPSPLTILIVQTIVLASGAIPIYWLAKDKLKNHFAAVCFAMLIYCIQRCRMLIWQMFTDLLLLLQCCFLRFIFFRKEI